MARLGVGKGPLRHQRRPELGVGSVAGEGGRSLGLSSGCGHRAEPSADSGVGLAFLLYIWGCQLGEIWEL